MNELTELRSRNRAVWSAGEYDAFEPLLREIGPRLLARVGIGPGMRVLDVGTGSGGNIAVPAAAQGAEVTGCDLTSAWFDAARRHAEAAGVEVEWVEADVEDLPFPDERFDRVLSTFGHMFAPRHEVASAEMIRVCASGGIVATTTWPAESLPGELLPMMARFLTVPPPVAQAPILWGDETHVREMLAPLALETAREVVRIHQPSVDALVRVYEEHFGPVVTARRVLGERWPEARRALTELIERWARPAEDGVAVEFRYLVSVGRKPA